VFSETKETHIEPSGTIARVKENRKVLQHLDDIDADITEMQYSEVTNLPEPQPETNYIVSPLVLEHSPGRDDLLVPENLVRDGDGRIIGCRSFAKRILHCG